MAMTGRTSARYPLHARLSPQDAMAVLEKRKERLQRGVFECKSCTDDGDDAPNGNVKQTIEQDARVAAAVREAKRAEMKYEREAREMTEKILAEIRRETDEANIRRKRAEESRQLAEMAAYDHERLTSAEKESPTMRTARSLSIQSDGDLSGIDTDGEDDYY